MENELTLFRLIQSTIRQKPFNGEIKDAKALYNLAKTHEVSGMVYPYLNKDTIGQAAHDRFKRDFHLYTLKDQQFSETINEVKTAFESSHIPHVFIKGAKLKQYYSEPHMRSMGDVDVLIPKDSMKAAHEALKTRSFTLTHESEQHDIFEHQNGSVVEVHPTLFKNINDKYAPLFKNEWDHTKHLEGYAYTLTPEFETVYLLYHIVKHFYGGGVGFRFFLDIGLYLEHHKDEMDMKRLRDLLHQGALEDFFHSSLHLVHAWFDLDPLQTERLKHPVDESMIEETTDFIARAGIHSSNPSFNAFESQAGAAGLTNTSKTRFILRKLFPRLSAMKGMYGYVRKFPFLLPIGWVHRLLSKLLFNRQQSLRKLHDANVDPQTREKVTLLYKKLGL